VDKKETGNLQHYFVRTLVRFPPETDVTEFCNLSFAYQQAKSVPESVAGAFAILLMLQLLHRSFCFSTLTIATTGKFFHP